MDVSTATHVIDSVFWTAGFLVCVVLVSIPGYMVLASMIGIVVDLSVRAIDRRP